MPHLCNLLNSNLTFSHSSYESQTDCFLLLQLGCGLECSEHLFLCSFSWFWLLTLLTHGMRDGWKIMKNPRTKSGLQVSLPCGSRFWACCFWLHTDLWILYIQVWCCAPSSFILCLLFALDCSTHSMLTMWVSKHVKLEWIHLVYYSSFFYLCTGSMWSAQVLRQLQSNSMHYCIHHCHSTQGTGRLVSICSIKSILAKSIECLQ